MKKRVLHLLASNGYSGAENVVCTIIDNCSDKYEMYYCSPDGLIRNVLEKKHINFIPLERLSIVQLKKIVKMYNINVVHAHDFQASFIASVLGVKVISQLHCDYNLLPISLFVGIVYSIIQRKFSKIIMVSKEILDNASFKKKIYDKTIIINNVVDCNKILNMSIEFDTDRYDLAFVGRLISLKQPLLFIDIVNELKKTNFNIKTCIVGDGKLYNECKKKILEYNLDKNIDLLGFKSNPFPYIKNSKILVMPSLYEGLGLVAIESMTLGTIVVNSGVGGLKTIFSEYLKYICNSKDDYINCIKELLKVDKSTYMNDCNKMIHGFINMKKYRNKFIKIYDEICK